MRAWTNSSSQTEVLKRNLEEIFALNQYYFVTKLLDRLCYKNCPSARVKMLHQLIMHAKISKKLPDFC